MNDITEIIDRLAQSAKQDGVAEFYHFSAGTVSLRETLLAAYREQAAELAELRGYKRKCEEQEPVAWTGEGLEPISSGLKRAHMKSGHPYYEKHYNEPLFALPKPAPVSVPEWQPKENSHD